MAGSDVHFDVTADDKTDAALAKAEANFRRTQEKMRRQAAKDQKDQESEIKRSLGSFTSLIQGISPKLAASVTKAFAGIGDVAGPLLVTGIAGAIAVGAPIIGGTVSAAIIGGAGLGGVIGGLLIAAKDPRVKAAGSEFADRLQERLTLAGSSFVQPAIDGIHIIERAIGSVNLEGIFRDSAKFVVPLAQSVGSAISSIGKGIADLIHNAGPVIQVIGQGIADLGAVVGEGFTKISKNGADAAGALNLFFAAVNATIGATLMFVHGLTQLYGVLRDIGGTGVLDRLALTTRTLSPGAVTAGAAFDDLGVKLGLVSDKGVGAANGLQSLQEQLDATTSSARNLFDTATSVGEAIDKVSAAAKKNGKTLDANTEKGRANREALSSLAKTLQAQYDATVAANGAGVKADRVAASNRASFIRLAVSLGAAKAEARRLADQILGIPAKRDVKVNANTHDAEARIEALREKLASVKGKTVNITVHYRGDGSNQNSPSIGGGGGRQFSVANWSAADRNGGSWRTGGATPVTVNSEVTVMLDGEVIGAKIDAKVRASEKRQIHRAQVGAR